MAERFGRCDRKYGKYRKCGKLDRILKKIHAENLAENRACRENRETDNGLVTRVRTNQRKLKKKKSISLRKNL